MIPTQGQEVTLGGGREGDLSTLLALWRGRSPEALSPRNYSEMSVDARKQGELLLAFDIAKEGLTKSPSDLSLRRAKALALADMGSTQAANDILEDLRREGNQDEETLGALARTFKDFWLSTGRDDYRFRAYQIYRQNRDAASQDWLGINAATLAWP